VGKVVFSSEATPRATGLEFRDEKGATYTVNANLEVILALGSIKTPLILQQSGVGPSDVLVAAGVTQRVDLPVGLNLIDQTTTTTNFGFSGNRGGGQAIAFPRFDDLFTGDDASTMRSMLQNDLASYVQDAVSSGSASSSSAAGLQKVLEIQRDWILNQNAAISENFDYTYDSTLGYDSWFLLPFGRGSIKIADNQPYANNFNINPRYFANPFDRLAQGGTARFTRRTSESSPLSNFVTGESTPGESVPNSGTLDQWAQWAEGSYRSNWHPIGTAPMMSRELGGCVDSNNKLVSVRLVCES
jgi:choline dehydrogenase-like flavoprotein